jgi:hypothetical protein
MADLLVLVAVWTHGEILMAARLAAISGNVQAAPKKRKRRIDVFGRDTLEIEIATNGTVGMERITEGHGAGVESGFALSTTPGIDAEEIEDVVRGELAARTSRVLALADWANHGIAAKPFWMRSE